MTDEIPRFQNPDLAKARPLVASVNADSRMSRHHRLVIEASAVSQRALTENTEEIQPHFGRQDALFKVAMNSITDVSRE